MCLFVNMYIHPDAEPLSRDVDLLVYKHLTVIGSSYITPIMCTPVCFVNGIAFLKSGIELKGFNFSADIRKCSYQCDKGVHSRISKHRSYPWKRFRAIIPGGTKFFVGEHGDIVAEKIIIFKTYFSYLKYCFWHSRPLKASKIYGSK